jgi:hypothetical protein
VVAGSRAKLSRACSCGGGGEDYSLIDLSIHQLYYYQEFLTRKSSGGHQAKQKRRKKPKPEEQEGMPQHQHRPPEKRRGDKNPECHEEQQKDIA